MIAAIEMVQEERGSVQWPPVVAGMSDVQKLVHLVWRKTADYVEQERQSILKHNRLAYEMTLEEEARSWGCMPGRASLREGRELKALNEHAKEVAAGIANTYNYDLAKAIIAIGQDTPTANRYLYSSRLALWEQEREKWKRPQISSSETFWAVNKAKEDFYRHNDLASRAEVVPYPTVCPICAEYVAGNPYRSIAALYAKCTLPAHTNCPHTARAITERRLTRRECQELWMG